MEQLTGRVAVITGGGSGLGEATASVFAEAGFAVACLDLNQQNAERVALLLVEQDYQATAVGCDVSDEQSVAAAIERVAGEFGRIDAVINCAAVDYVVSVNEMHVEQWDRVLDVNLRGPFLMAKAVWPYMQRQGSGHIVNIASTAATRAWGNAAAYHASKWGLVGFSRGLGVEGRDHGIKVTTVIPGGMRTHWFDSFPERGIPMPDEAHLQDPRNVAEVILFAVQMPAPSSMQEVIVTPVTETSWP
ncbi:MAG TPA: SDR family oxidoreductase [Thermomicrobiales bacterium]|nr:SDR family oxidoreductase [Thermomicrobiales bacterium]